MKKLILSTALLVSSPLLAVDKKVTCQDANNTNYNLVIDSVTGETEVVYGTNKLTGRTVIQNGTYEMRATDESPFDWTATTRCWRMKPQISMQVQASEDNKYTGLVFTMPAIEFREGYNYQTCGVPMFVWNPQYKVTCQAEKSQFTSQPRPNQKLIALGAAMKELALYLGTRAWAGGPPHVAGEATVLEQNKVDLLGEKYDQYKFEIPTTHVTFGAGKIVMSVLMKGTKVVKVSFGN